MGADTMTRPRRMFIAGVALAIVGVGAVVVAQEQGLPGFATAEEQESVQQPESGQRVAVLQIDLRSGDGGSVSAELLSQQVIDSFAPKSTSRSGGDWEVRVLGERTLAFQVNDPLNVEVENPEDQDDPFDTIRLESYEWTLVVPLYDDGEPLGANAIEIVDLATGASILRASLET